MKNIIYLFFIIIILFSCSKNPITGKRYFILYPQFHLNESAKREFQIYRQFIQESRDASKKRQVKEVSNRVLKAAEVFYAAHGKRKKFQNNHWEVILVDNTEINAFALPGGKIVINTGILPIAENDSGLASIIGHEIGHILSKHGNQRMTQILGAKFGEGVLNAVLEDKSEETQNAFQKIYGAGINLGALLPFSRKHEKEADEIGLYFAAIAGYDPNEAVAVWERMQSEFGGARSDFLSTHPSHIKRIENLTELIPKAEMLAKDYKIPDTFVRP